MPHSCGLPPDEPSILEPLMVPLLEAPAEFTESIEGDRRKLPWRLKLRLQAAGHDTWRTLHALTYEEVLALAATAHERASLVRALEATNPDSGPLQLLPLAANQQQLFDRHSAALRMRQDGARLRTIAGRLGVSVARVSQMLKACGGPTGEDLARRREAASRTTAEAEASLVLELFCAGLELPTIAGWIGVPQAAVSEVLRRHASPEDRRVRRRRRALDLGGDNRQVLLSTLQEAARRLGRTPTVVEYRTLSPRGRGPSAVIRRFGTWTAGLEAAGLQPLRHRRRRSDGPWTHHECRRAIAGLVAELGRRPAWDEYRTMAATTPELRAIQTLHRVVGRWAEVLALADEELEEPRILRADPLAPPCDTPIQMTANGRWISHSSHGEARPMRAG